MNEKNKLSSQEYSQNVEEKVAIASELLKNVQNNVLEILHPDRYVKYLNMIERFHWYSYINNLLILSQYPQAQYLAGFDVWKRTALATYNDPNRRFLKSTSVGKAIKLIAPFTVVNGSSRSLVNATVPVYDVSQMNEVPMPENDFLDIKKCSYVDIINAINFVAPYRTVFASNEDKNLSHNIKGYCNHSRGHFVVDSRLSARGLLSVLLHEYAAAELFLHNYKNDYLQGLIVESVFYILIKHFRLNADEITFSYVSRFQDSDSASIVEVFFLIQTIAHSIIEKVEDHLEYLIELIPSEEDFSYQMDFFDNLEPN